MVGESPLYSLLKEQYIVATKGLEPSTDSLEGSCSILLSYVAVLIVYLKYHNSPKILVGGFLKNAHNLLVNTPSHFFQSLPTLNQNQGVSL